MFRDTEWSLLEAFIRENPKTLSANVIVSGYKSAGKTHTVLKYLDTLNVRKTIINCDEFVTHKILLQKCLLNIRADSGVDLQNYHQKFMYKGLEAARMSLLCETFAQFLMALQQFADDTGYNEPHVLVLDRFDLCIDPTHELFRSFVRFREHSTLSNLSVIYITSHDIPGDIASVSVPRIHFSPYTQAQTTHILQQSPPIEVDEGFIDKSFWANFAKLMVDLFFDYTGSDLTLLKNISEKIWPKFSQHFMTKDFLAIYRDLKSDIMLDEVINNSAVESYTQTEQPGHSAVLADLPYHSKFILIASYLASFTDQKYDVQIFSKLKSIKKRSPKKPELALSKSNIDSRLLTAAYFDLERLKAILSVIYRNESSTLSKDNKDYFNLFQELTDRDLAKKENEFNVFTLNTSVDVNIQISTLTSLGLLNKTYATDTLSSRIRWRCNVTWEIIEGLAKDIHFPLHSYMLDTVG